MQASLVGHKCRVHEIGDGADTRFAWIGLELLVFDSSSGVSGASFTYFETNDCTVRRTAR